MVENKIPQGFLIFLRRLVEAGDVGPEINFWQAVSIGRKLGRVTVKSMMTRRRVRGPSAPELPIILQALFPLVARNREKRKVLSFFCQLCRLAPFVLTISFLRIDRLEIIDVPRSLFIFMLRLDQIRYDS